MKFRMVPDIGVIGNDEKEFYEESGWRYVGNDRTPLLANDAEAEELFTDGESFKSRAKDFQSNNRWLIILSVFWIAYIVHRIYSDYRDPGLMHTIEDGNIGLWVYMCIVMIWLLVFETFRIITTSSVVKRIKRCEKLRRNIPRSEYGRRALINKFFNVLAALILVSSVFVLAGVFDEDIEISDNRTNHPVSMQTFDPKGYVEVKKAAATERGEEDDAGYQRATWTNNVFEGVWHDHGWSYNNDNDKYDVYYYACIYKARSEGRAERYLKEEIYTTTGGKSPEDIEIKGYGIDYVGYGKDEDGDPSLFLRDGSKLETVTCKGEVDLKSKIDIFIEDIESLR